MNNFNFHNPTRIIFGKGTIAELSKHIPKKAKILLTYGGGSIKSNGVYDQVIKALKKREVLEFGGIEANPDYDTLMKAVKLVRKKKVDFLLAVGGGSVIDGTKFIAIAAPYNGKKPWNLLAKNKARDLKTALPLGTVLTLPATGSEMNNNSVISRRSKEEKFAFASELLYPVFSILDPETTFSLPLKQVRNGLVDAFVHVMEQYVTYPAGAALQDRQAEAILQTLIEISPKAMQIPPNYDARASFMWAATNSLNRLIGAGVPTDWATHAIGHELTAFYGLAHAESLAVVMPYLLWYKRDKKAEKLIRYAQHVWKLRVNDPEEMISLVIEKTAAFFLSLGMPTTLTAYGIDPDEAAQRIQERFTARGTVLGEHADILPEDVAAILRMSR